MIEMGIDVAITKVLFTFLKKNSNTKIAKKPPIKAELTKLLIELLINTEVSINGVTLMVGKFSFSLSTSLRIPLTTSTVFVPDCLLTDI